MEKLVKEIDKLEKEEKLSLKQNVKFYSSIFSSIKSGIIGFIIVFSLVVFSKLLFLSANHLNEFTLSINDFVLSFWGFLIVSFVVFSSQNNLNSHN